MWGESLDEDMVVHREGVPVAVLLRAYGGAAQGHIGLFRSRTITLLLDSMCPVANFYYSPDAYATGFSTER